jgi:RNA polymerase sigma-70 factor (ECF subfamily)
MSRAVPEGIEARVQDAAALAEPRDTPTFGRIYDEHFRFVWRTLRRLGVPDFEVDDALQDVFLVVHRRLADFEPNAPVRHWLYRITFRIARDHRRSRRRKDPATHGLEPVSDVDAVADAKTKGPAESAERSAAARLIRDILGELDDPKREVFALADLEQMSAPEIAEVLEIPLNTVYSRLRAARRDFEAALERHRRTLGERTEP